MCLKIVLIRDYNFVQAIKSVLRNMHASCVNIKRVCMVKSLVYVKEEFKKTNNQGKNRFIIFRRIYSIPLETLIVYVNQGLEFKSSKG